ncbi:MAG: hypothetical protein DRN03_05270 [Thermoplasmata archaeon]|nr:MAG: hypothetical protein DRN03_05270 [Thermoplasmata archaeon]
MKVKYEQFLAVLGILCITAICITALINKIDSAVVASVCSTIVFLITRKHYKKKLKDLLEGE